MKKKPFYTPNEVAELLMVSPVTVRQWAQKGKLNALTTLGGHRRFELDEIKRFALENNITLFDNSGDTFRVLVIDDNHQLASYLKELLEINIEGVEVKIANNGFRAGLLVHTFQPDVVLLDLMMPEMDGFDVCRVIKVNPETENIRVIAMTGFHSQENVQRILNEGAEICLAKPVDAEQLLDIIKKDRKHLSSSN